MQESEFRFLAWVICQSCSELQTRKEGVLCSFFSSIGKFNPGHFEFRELVRGNRMSSMLAVINMDLLSGEFGADFSH